MDNIDSIFDKSKYITVQQNQIQLLKELVTEKLTVGQGGGLFVINSELLNFLDLLDHQFPLEIQSLADFFFIFFDFSTATSLSEHA